MSGGRFRVEVNDLRFGLSAPFLAGLVAAPYLGPMTLRRRRSISLPIELDAQIAAVAAREGVTVSAWFAEAVARRLQVDGGRRVIEEWQVQHGAFNPEEQAEARAWVGALLADA